MRLAPVIIILALCACGSPIAAPLGQVTQAPGLAIQAVSAQQTANAASAQSTQAADNVARAQAAIVQATANAQSTRDALAWRATETTSAIQLAQMQYSATVQAQATQVFQTQAAESRMIADGQERARATATAEAIERNARSEADWEEAGRLLKGALVFTAFAGGLTAVVVIVIMLHSTIAQLRDISLDYFQAQAAMKQAEADKARIIWRMIEERGKRTEIAWYTPPNGGMPYQLLPEARFDDGQDDIEKEREWKIAVSRFVTHAGNGSFSFTRLGPPNKNSREGQGLGVVDRDSWDLLTEYMVSNQWLHSNGERSKTAWGAGWSKERFFSEVMHGEKPLPPFPVEKGVPNVRS